MRFALLVAIGTVLLACAVALPVWAGGWSSRAGGWSSSGNGAGRSLRGPGARLHHTRTGDLRSFTASRRLEAGDRLREIARDAERRAAEQRLRSQGTLAEVRAHRVRIRAEDDTDRMRRNIARRHAAHRGYHPAHDPRWLASLSPRTRQVILDHGSELRRVRREAEREERMEALEAQVEAREPAPSPLLSGVRGVWRRLFP